jgi:hypothetical protein
MTNEKSLQVAQGLSILSLLIAAGRIPGKVFSAWFKDGTMCVNLELAADGDILMDLSDADRARLLDAIEMVSP